MFLATAGAGFGGRGTAPFDITNAHYDNISFNSSLLGNIGGIFFKDDGTKLYVSNKDTPSGVYQFSLSEAWKISTASYDGVLAASSSEDISAYGIFIGSSGTKLYICGNSNDKIYQYTLATAWASSTSSYDGVSIASSTEDTEPVGVFLKSDGTKLYILGTQNNNVFQYTLSTAWASSTATYDSISFSSTNISGRSVVFNNDGTKAFIENTSLTIGGVYQFNLTTAWASSTASSAGLSFLPSQGDLSNACAFSADGNKLYIANASDTTIYQYSL